MITTFTLNFILSAYYGRLGDLSNPGLLNLGKFENIPYVMMEIPFFVCMGIIGGLFGAMWNHINYKVACFRAKYITEKWIRVVEALSMAFITTTLAFAMIYLINDCKPKGKDPIKYPIQMYCKEDEYSAVGALWFQTPESTVKSLFHDPKGG